MRNTKKGGGGKRGLIQGSVQKLALLGNASPTGSRSPEAQTAEKGKNIQQIRVGNRSPHLLAKWKGIKPNQESDPKPCFTPVRTFSVSLSYRPLLAKGTA